MDQLPQSEWDNRDTKIAQLEAELSRAYQVIHQLRQRNSELQDQINNFNQSKEEPKPINLTEDYLSHSYDEKYKYSQPEVSRMGKIQLSRFQFFAIVTAVVGCFTISGLVINSLLNWRSSVQVSPPISPQVELPPLANLVYNVRRQQKFRQSQQLQRIVDEVVGIATDNGLPTPPLSITLIDMKTGEVAGYQQQQLRYPASVVKMFWMVALYATLQEGTILDERAFTTDLQKMIKKSDNEAASRVLDQISDAESGSELEAENYQAWLNKRKQVNKFFLDAGYQDINVSQKTFPIPYLNLYEPKGRDLQMRGDPNQPIRNKITTHHAARLLYEIMAGQAVSPEYSQQMINLLTIDPATRIQKRNLQDPNQFNPVRGFFSQSLPDDIYFAAKAGWTSGSRQEAAYIATQDGRTAYILVIFAEDRSYAYDWKIFPKLSRHVFNRMTERAVVQ